MAIPPLDGGGIVSTFSPRNDPFSGATTDTAYPDRSPFLIGPPWACMVATIASAISPR